MKGLSSIWRGSERTYQEVKRQIESRYGSEAAVSYDPLRNCFTFRGWAQRGYRVKSGERGIKVNTFIEVDNNGEKKLIPHAIYLFAQAQVDKLN